VVPGRPRSTSTSLLRHFFNFVTLRQFRISSQLVNFIVNAALSTTSSTSPSCGWYSAQSLLSFTPDPWSMSPTWYVRRSRGSRRSRILSLLHSLSYVLLFHFPLAPHARILLPCFAFSCFAFSFLLYSYTCVRLLVSIPTVPHRTSQTAIHYIHAYLTYI
jgi:hypothetical protein